MPERRLSEEELRKRAKQMEERDREFVADTRPPLQGGEEARAEANRPRADELPRRNLWDRVKRWLSGGRG